MSGPKGGGYVISEAVRQQQALERARQAARVAEDELRAALRDVDAETSRIDDLDITVPPLPIAPPEGADIESVRDHTRQLTALRSTLLRELSQAHRRRRGRLVAAHLQRETQRHEQVTAADVLGDEDGSASTSAPVEQTLTRLLTRLRDDVATSDLDAVEAAAERMSTARTAEDARSWEVELRQRIARANDAVQRREQDRARARDLLADLRTLEGDSRADLDAALVEVLEVDGTLTDALVEEVRAAVQEDAARADSRLVTSAVGDVLTELGYDVGEDFDTALVRDGSTHIRGRDQGWRDHGVRIRLDPESQEMVFHVVRAADRPLDPTADQQVEDGWCTDLASVIERIAEREITLSITSALSAGEVPVPPVERDVLDAVSVPGDSGDAGADEAEDRRTRRRRRQRRPQERSR